MPQDRDKGAELPEQLQDQLRRLAREVGVEVDGPEPEPTDAELYERGTWWLDRAHNQVPRDGRYVWCRGECGGTCLGMPLEPEAWEWLRQRRPAVHARLEKYRPLWLRAPDEPESESDRKAASAASQVVCIEKENEYGQH